MNSLIKLKYNFNDKNINDIQLNIEKFRHVRENYKKALIDDYLELISDLNFKFTEVRQIDIAAYLGVSQPTVAKMLKKLVLAGFVKHLFYRSVLLTENGKKLAKKIKQRHQIVKSFLIALGSNPKIAGIDAEGIEHYVSEETLNIFQKFYQKNFLKLNKTFSNKK